jgi:ascorbate-specific PTS system EIIC-type component UlaA
MSITRARVALVTVFLVGFVSQVLAIAATYLKGEILSKELLALLVKILAVYSVPFAVILGSVFGESKGGVRRASAFAFWLAVILAAIWNLLLAWRTLTFSLATEDSVPELSTYLETISSGGSFLVAGALAYFFAKRGST